MYNLDKVSSQQVEQFPLFYMDPHKIFLNLNMEHA